jgi:hypothetical protein
MSYANDRYSVVERKWFGLTKKWGGDCATGYALTGNDSGTTIKHMDKGYYPKGPIRIVKWGAMVLATVTATKTVGKLPHYIQVGTAAKTGLLNLVPVTKAIAPAVQTTVTGYIDVADGKTIKIMQGTPVTSKGTAQVTGTQAGTVAFFIDYVRRHHANWDF